METLKYYICLCLISVPVIQANPAASTPSVKVSAEQLKIAAGGSDSVTCTPGGYPLPSVQWRKYEGGFGAGTTVSGDTLTIGDAQDGDRGYYVCVGVLGATEVAQKYVYVEIEDAVPPPPGNPKVTVSQPTVSIPKGGRGSIVCIPEGNPLPRVEWKKSDGEFGDGVTKSGNRLIISDAREEDQGDYVCEGIVQGTVMTTDYARVVIDDAVPPPPGNPKVTVSQRTVSIPKGGRGSIVCIPEGNPLPRVEWKKSDGKFGDGVIISGDTLIISDAQEEDQGHYVCEGIVQATVMSTDYARVDIEDADPPPPGNPKVTVSQRTASIPKGGRGSIMCISEGNPLPRVEWKKSDGEFGDGVTKSGNRLIFSDAREEDQGDYVCEGIVQGTVMTTDYARVVIEDAVPPPPRNPKVTVSQRTVSIPKGGRGSILCIPEGNPLPRVEWKKSNGEIGDGVTKSDNRLIISDAREEDQGDYVCEGIVQGTVMTTDYARVVIEDAVLPPPGNPKVTVSQPTVSIPKGGRGSIVCIPEGNPLPRVEWKKSDGKFGDGVIISGDTLIISDAQEEDQGHYVCEGIVQATVMSTDYARVDIEDAVPPPPRNPKVTVSQRTVSIPKGGRGSILCIPEGNPLPRVEWKKSDGKFGDGVIISGDTLIISDAQEEDQGHYVCEGIVQATVMSTDYARVDIEDADPPPPGNPKVTVSQRTASIPKGGRGSIMCIPEGNPLPRVEWKKSDGEFGDGVTKSGNRLIFSDAREEDQGDYVCEGIVQGTVMTTDYARVVIEDAVPPPPRNPKVTVSQRTVSIPKGGRGSILCIPEGNPLPRVEWKKSNGEIGDGVTKSDNRLIISDAREEDQGDYVCEGIVQGTVMTTDYARVVIEDAVLPPPGNPKVTVSQPTVSIPKGGRGSIVCIPEGNPLPRVEWKKSDGEFGDGVTKSGNRLTISEAREEDQGDYVCEGIVQGTVMTTDYARVIIEDADPPPPGNPKVTVSQRTVSIPKGGRGSIMCIPEGNPLPRVEWKKSDGEFGDGVTKSGNRLIISDAREEDQGDYVCEGIVQGTVMTTDYARVVIEDADPPPPGNPKVTVSQRTVSIPKGGRGSIMCIPEGYPLPRVEWKKSDGEFGDGVTKSGNRLIISDAREEDQGDYVCEGIVQGTVMTTGYARVVIEDAVPPPPGNPKVTVSQRTVSIPKGGHGSILCIPEGNPLPRVEWKKSDGEFGDGVTKSGNRLIISDAREEDQGDYVCEGIVQGTVMTTGYARVVIEDAVPPPPGNPKVTVSQRTVSIPKGGHGSILCIPEGNPLPKVEWKKSNGKIGDGVTKSGNRLIISDAREEDQGDYVCEGIVQGTVMTTDYARVVIEDAVLPPPGNPKVTVSQPTVSIPKGGRGSIVCIPEGNPLPRVEWKKSDGEFGDGVTKSGNRLIISDAREEDQGDYVCEGIVQGTVMTTDYARVVIEDAVPPPPGNPKVTVSQRTVSIPKGGHGSILCIPEGNPLPRVEWKKSNGEIGDGVTKSGNRLIISDAREEDQGDYVCEGIVQGTVMTTEYARVVIEDAVLPPPGNPKVTVSQRTVSIPKGGHGSILCIPEGNPLPRVEWKKSNGEIGDGVTKSGNRLIISDAREEDQGDYVCEGIVQGTVMTTDYARVVIEDAVLPPPGNPKVTVSQPTVSIPKGGRGSIVCIPEGNPLPRVEWKKSDGKFGDGIIISGDTLIISDAREEDQGHYVCEGIVQATVMSTDYARVEIASRPDQLFKPVEVLIKEGAGIRMSCDFNTGDHEQQFTWTRSDQRPLPQNVENVGYDLAILSATQEDSGEYMCSVTAGRGGFLLRVALFRVEVLSLPLVYVHPAVQTATRGQAVAVECSVDVEGAQVTWERVSEPLSSRVKDRGSQLYFSGIEVEDAGYYRCSARNGAGISSGIAQVIVEDPTRLPRHAQLIVSERELIIPTGGSATIECTPEGNPLPRVQWIKSNGEFRDGVKPNGGTLIISDAREEDRGHYVCEGILDGTVMLTNYSRVDVRDEPQTSPPANLRSSNVIVSHKELTIPIGETVHIGCTPEGSPLPTVRWKKSNGEFRDGVRPSGNTLIISDAREEDQGDYVCEGIVQGTVMTTDYARVVIEDVEQPSVVAGDSRVQVAVRHVKIPRGGTRNIDCIPEGNPLPTIQWNKYEGAFGVGTRQSGNALVITDAQEQDGGNYVCDGMVDGTAAWTDYLAVEIESTQPISQSLVYPRVTVNMRHLRIPRGGTMAIDCIPEGSPLPTIQWTKDEGNFSVGTTQAGNSLVIKDAQEEDRGNYVCSAVVNGESVFSDYLTVEIQYNCELPKDTGMCLAAYTRWYYNPAQQKCQKFVWGGCGGNKNNFETEEHCSLECESMRPVPNAA